MSPRTKSKPTLICFEPLQMGLPSYLVGPSDEIIIKTKTGANFSFTNLEPDGSCYLRCGDILNRQFRARILGVVKGTASNVEYERGNGRFTAERRNVIVFPTAISGLHYSTRVVVEEFPILGQIKPQAYRDVTTLPAVTAFINAIKVF